MNKTRVLYFCSSAVFGGAERFVESCLNFHSEDERFDSLVFFLNKGDFTERCLKKGFCTYISNIRVRLINPLSWLIFQIYFYQFLKKHKINVAHLTMAYSQFFAALACKLAGVKVIWYQHGPIDVYLDRLANMLPYDQLIFNSQFTQNDHIKKAGKIKSSLSIVPPYIPVKANPKYAAQIKDRYGEQIFLCFGRICRWKGYETAIKAIMELGEKHTLLVIGKPSTEDDKEYEKELHRLKASNIHFLGFKENIYDYILAADAVVHCSNQPEPFGLSIYESIALGTYVFATDMGATKELIKSDKTGQLYQANNHKDLVEKINNSSLTHRKIEYNKTHLPEQSYNSLAVHY